MSDFLSGLSVETAELPKSEGGRGRKVKDNPFTAWVRDSYADGNGRQVTVPGANAKEACYLIRQAAQDLGLGVRVVALNAKGVKLDAKTVANLAESKSTAKVTVMFQGKEKRAYERRQGTTATGTTPAE